MIPTVDYTPAALEPVLNPGTGRPLDLSFASLRSVSPIHLEYLREHGCGSIDVVSLLVEGKLWGLVACHHQSAHFVPAAARAACELLGQAASTEIAAKQEARRLAELSRAQAVQSRFFDVISGEENVFAALVRYTPQLLEFMGAGGAAVWVDGRCTLLGHTPSREAVETVVRFLETRELTPLLATDHLAALLTEAAAWSDVASGMLAVPALAGGTPFRAVVPARGADNSALGREPPQADGTGGASAPAQVLCRLAGVRPRALAAVVGTRTGGCA